MSVILDARDVLTYLNELGYTNINAQQLKEFMKDLKRLIKYEEQCSHQYLYQDHQEEEEEKQQCPCQQAQHQPNELKCCSNQNFFDILYNSETIASLAKKKSQNKTHVHKDRVITVQINKPCTQHGSVANIVPEINCAEGIQTGPCNLCQRLRTAVEDEAAKSQTDDVDGPMTAKSCPSLPLTSTTLAEKKKTRPKSARSSFIRPKVFTKPLKSDPVALYHQYKQEWDKIKFPGEHHHGETRWAVREKLLGDRYY